MVADESNINGDIIRDSPLDTDAEVGYIRRAQVWVHHQNAALLWFEAAGERNSSVSTRRRETVQGLARSTDWAVMYPIVRDCPLAGWASTGKRCPCEADVGDADTTGARNLRPVCIKGSSGGIGAQPKRVANAIKHIETQLFVQEAGSRAKHGLSIPQYIPGEARARAEIVVIPVIGSSNSAANLNQSFGGVEIGEQVVPLFFDTIDFIAKPQVQGQSLSDAPVVLNEGGISRCADVPYEVSSEGNCPVRYAAEEPLYAQLHSGHLSAEAYGALGIRGDIRCTSIAQDFSAEFERVATVQVGDVIQNLQNSIRAYSFRPARAENPCEWLNRDSRKSTIEWIRLAGVEVVGGALKAEICRILGIVLALEHLVVMRIPNSGFVYPSGIRGPSPAPRECLRPRILIRHPDCVCLCSGSVIQNSASRADEIHGAQRVFLADVVIHFPEARVNPVITGQSGAEVVGWSRWRGQ